MRKPRLKLLIAAALGIILAPGVGFAAPAPSESVCKARVNGTPEKLLECTQRHILWLRLKSFQKIADNHPGSKGHPNRDTGSSGYRASVQYVAQLMRKAGYRVRIQPYEWKRFKLLAPPRFTTDAGPVGRRGWFVARLSGDGAVNAPVQPLFTPGKDGDSATGCSPAEFKAFRPGNIALLRRGACSFDAQVANAQRSGAAAVILYNASPDADPAGGKAHDDGRAFPAQLEEPAAIPVIGVASHALGAGLAQRYRAGLEPRAGIAVGAMRKSDTDYNVIADSPYGYASHTLVVDAHLDSIYGAGILDNASGSATILELALNLAHTRTRNRLRYIWFGGEELGLLGSKFYTRNLSVKERRGIAFDIDVDVTATPNFDVLIADPGHARNAGKFPPNVAPDSEVGNRAFLRYFRSAGIAARKARFGNDGTDSNAFSLIGVPDSGILTQQNCCKHEWEVRLWGGYLGNYEGKVPGRNGGCVDWPRRWCDNLANNDPFVLEFVSKAVASAALELANFRFEKKIAGRSRPM